MLSSREMLPSRNQIAADYAPVGHRPIEYLTENGFSIVRPGEGDGTAGAPEGRYVFMVRDPRGSEREITVSIAQQAVNEITLRSRGRVSSESSYWICCAERHLAEYLWENDNYPPEEVFKVEQLTPEDVNLAIRWGTK